MADDRRPQSERRVGDATQARIDDMATGWKKPGDDDASEKPRASPPPPPPAAKPPSSRPPPLPAAAKLAKSGPTIPKAVPSTRTGSSQASGGASPQSVTATTTASHQTGPAHARTIRRGAPVSAPAVEPPPLVEVAAELVPVLPKPIARAEGSPLPVPRKSTSSSGLARATQDATVVPTGEELPLAELKPPAALPRVSGLWGDMKYVGTVVRGRRRLRIELAETELEIEAEKRSRDKELTEFAKLAISDPDVEAPVVEAARERLVELEEARSRKAGAAVAAEQAIGAILRERDKIKDEREEKVTLLEGQIAALEAKLGPLEKERLEIGKRAREVTRQVEDYDERIAELDTSLESAALEDAASAEATLAGLRAEREVAAGRQPALAAELAGVEPSIRDFKAEKGELAKTISKLRRAEDESVVRSEEKVTAARAHKLVVDRAAADRTREQNELLRDLGEDLYRQPPAEVAHLAVPLEDRFSTLERLKAKAVVAREKIESVETMPLVRGYALWFVVFALIAAIGFGVFTLVG